MTDLLAPTRKQAADWLICAIIILSVSSCLSPPQTRLMDPKSELAIRLQDTYKLSANAIKPVFYEGEDVYLSVHIDTFGQAMTGDLGGRLDYQNLFALWRNDAYISNELFDRDPGALTIFGLDWTDRDGDGQTFIEIKSRKGPLKPGHYRGFVDDILTSNWFEFDILSRPDSLNDFYEEVKTIFLIAHTPPESANITKESELARIAQVLRFFEKIMKLSPDYPYVRYIHNVAMAGLHNSRAIREISSEDSVLILDIARHFAMSEYRIDYYDYGIYFALMALAEGRGRNWRGEAAIGAYLAELNDNDLYASVVRFLKGYRNSQNYYEYFCGPRDTINIGIGHNDFG